MALVCVVCVSVCVWGGEVGRGKNSVGDVSCDCLTRPQLGDSM